MWSLLPGSLALVATVSFFLYRVWVTNEREKDLRLLENEYGCAPTRPWVARWFMGLDLLVIAFWHGYRRTLMQFFTDVSERSGITHEQRLLGVRNIGTTAPANLEAILHKQAKEFDLGFRSPQFRDLLGDGVFTQDGATWRHSRNLLRPVLSSSRLQGFDQIRRCVDSMLDGIVPNAVIDMQPRLFQLTMETTLFMLFGGDAHRIMSSRIAEGFSEVTDAFSVAQEYLAYRTRLGSLHWLINGPRMWKACRTVHAFMDTAIEQALAFKPEQSAKPDESRKHVFIDALIEQTRDKRVLRDQCLSLLLAGRDTTAVCLSWTLRLLARRQEALAKLRDEVAAIVGLGPDARQPTQEDLNKMSYLKLVLKESLRLYPPIPVNQRAASQTTTLPEGGGPDGRSKVLVREGESVGYLVYALHRRQDIYGPNADDFKPDRWKDDALKDVGYGYLPFGAGQRACLGQQFAMLEASYTIVRIIQRFPFVTVLDSQPMMVAVYA